MNNWLHGAPNPFQTVVPPNWWLRELWLFDDKLVIFPSQKRNTLILARRARISKGEPLHDAKGVTQNPDTLLMHRHRLLRVTEIMPGVIWDMRVFRWLANHDIHRLGGATAVSDRLEAMDAKKAQSIRDAQNDELHNRSSDAYKAYKFKIGERISLAPNPHGRGTLVKKPVSVHVRKPSAPSAPVLTAPSPA